MIQSGLGLLPRHAGSGHVLHVSDHLYVREILSYQINIFGLIGADVKHMNCIRVRRSWRSKMISKKFVFKNHGLVTSSIKYESYEISDGDPLSSQARLGWEFEYGRGDWAVRTVTETQMKCDR